MVIAGWYEGKRVSDNAIGWFPSSYVAEMLNDHVRARNYRQRLKLIQVVFGVLKLFWSLCTYSMDGIV